MYKRERERERRKAKGKDREFIKRKERKTILTMRKEKQSEMQCTKGTYLRMTVLDNLTV